MKNLSRSCIVLCSVLAFPMLCSEPEILPEVDFLSGSFEDALDQAEQVGLPIFMYLTIPNCTPCEYMETQVFTDALVGEFLNDRFVNFKLDAFDEDANGPTISKRYGVGSYPTYLILDQEGNITHRSTSGMSAQNFIRAISWLTGEIESPMSDYDAKYAAGERDPDFVQQYLLDSRLEISLLPKDMANWEANMKAYDAAREKYTAITKEYLGSKSTKGLINSKDLSIIHNYCTNLDDLGIKLVMDNFDAYVDATSLSEVSGLLLEVVSYAAMTKAFEGDESYIDVLDLFEEEPLKHAAEWRRGDNPESGQLPENQRDHLAEIYSSAKDETSEDSQD